MGRNELEAIITNGMKTDSRGRRDLCSIYADRKAFDALVEYLAEPYMGKVDYVASPESLGFILGSSLASKLQVGLIPIRNAQVSYLDDEDAVKASYIDHRDNVRTLQTRKGNIPKGSRILLVDDWVETAATIQACNTIIEESDAVTIGIASLGVRKGKATKSLIERNLIRSVLVESDGE